MGLMETSCPTPVARSLPAFPSIIAPVPLDNLPFLDFPTLGRAWVWAAPGRNQCLLMSATGKGFCHPLGAKCSTVAQSNVPGKSTLEPRVAPPFSPCTSTKSLRPKLPGRSHSSCSGLLSVPYSFPYSSQEGWLPLLFPPAKPFWILTKQIFLLFRGQGRCYTWQGKLKGTIC